MSLHALCLLAHNDNFHRVEVGVVQLNALWDVVRKVPVQPYQHGPTEIRDNEKKCICLIIHYDMHCSICTEVWQILVNNVWHYQCMVGCIFPGAASVTGQRGVLWAHENLNQ